MTLENITVLDFNDYPDIDLREFAEWFRNKFFKDITVNLDTDWYNGKYDVEIWFHEDTDNNQFSIELKLNDVTDISEENRIRFEEMFDDAGKFGG